MPDEAYIEFARRHRWLAGWRRSPPPGYFAHTVESFCSGGASLPITLANEEVVDLPNED
ncbi:hypothetical protein ACNKHM_23670 [Shigella sonnei]